MTNEQPKPGDTDPRDTPDQAGETPAPPSSAEAVEEESGAGYGNNAGVQGEARG